MSDSNSGSTDATRAIIFELVETANRFGSEAFYANLEIGERLTEAKETIRAANNGKRGGFEEWCEASGFPFSKQWRARLMKLAALRDKAKAYIKAREDGEVPGGAMTGKDWSVDGMLANLAALAKAADAEGGDGGEGDGEGEGGGSGEKKKSKAEMLREELAAAMERIAELEAENAKLRGGKKEGKAKPEGDAKPDGEGADEAPSYRPNAADRKRAEKVFAFLNPDANAAEGEIANSISRITAMAEKAGVTVEDFITACGLTAAWRPNAA